MNKLCYLLKVRKQLQVIELVPMTPPLPPDAEGDRLGRALGVTRARIEVLRLALARHEVTAAELMDELGLSRSGLGRHLAILTDEGLLSERRATHPRGSGPVIYWIANADAVRAAIDAFSRRILSDDSLPPGSEDDEPTR
ncbi:ArsR/SmtB family transcription factor [Microbacterium sp.]|uniref:ArsR/SmtB family transcription factor n=1 Tax=Microbacterium sp. TaxID=51671 RepID=UPI003F9D1DF3